jgi:hypothetical protein
MMVKAPSPPEGGLYIKPDPCYAATPTTDALASPIMSCTKFLYHVGSMTRSDCSKYSVPNDDTGCWIAVTYDPGSGQKQLQVSDALTHQTLCRSFGSCMGKKQLVYKMDAVIHFHSS